MMSETVQTERVQADDLFEKRWVKILLFLFIPGAVFVLISAGIRVSQYGIDHTILILCQKQLVSGSAGAMRVTLIDDNAGFFLPERISAKLIKDGKAIPLFDGEVLSTGYAVARNFQIPRVAPGTATMEIHVYFDRRQRVIRKPVEIVSRYADASLIYPTDVKPNAPVSMSRDGNTVIRLYPEGRGAPAGLPSLLFVQTTDGSDMPLSAPYRLQLPVFRKGDAPREVAGTTDGFGLDAFVVAPTDIHFPIRVTHAQTKNSITVTDDTDAPDTADGVSDGSAADQRGDRVSSASEKSMADSESTSGPTVLSPSVVYSGMKIDFKTPLVEEKGEDIEVKVQGISGDEPVYLDVFHANQWIFSETGWIGDDGRATFSFPAPAAGVLRIQVTTSPLQYNRNVVVRHVYAKRAGEDLAAVLGAILAVQKDERHRKWLRTAQTQAGTSDVSTHGELLVAFALSTLYNGHSSAPMLVSSRKEDDSELNAFKQSFQTGLMVAILFLGVAVSVLIAVIAWQSSRRLKLMTQMILEEDNDRIAETPAVGQRIKNTAARQLLTSRIASRLQVATLFLVVLAAFAAIALLVMTMSWNRM